jgi:hypothetical protein
MGVRDRYAPHVRQHPALVSPGSGPIPGGRTRSVRPWSWGDPPKRKDFKSGQIVRVMDLPGWHLAVGRVLAKKHKYDHMVRLEMLSPIHGGPPAASGRPRQIWASAGRLVPLEGLELLAWSWEGR